MKRVEKIRARWHPRKIVAYLTFVFLMSLFLFGRVYTTLSKYTEIGEWRRSSMISVMIFTGICLIIYLCIYIKYKKEWYYINTLKFICVKENKKIEYKRVYYTQTFLQKIFGLINMYFINEEEMIELKDVSIKLNKHIDATKLSVKPRI